MFRCGFDTFLSDVYGALDLETLRIKSNFRSSCSGWPVSLKSRIRKVERVLIVQLIELRQNFFPAFRG